MQFFFSPLQGALSDSFGRRLMILISNFGVGLDYVLMALAPTLGWLFVGRVISGITAASISTAYAYVADVTPPEKRAARFGLLGAAFGAGFVLGPALGGLAGNDVAAAAVLDRRGLEPGQCALWTVRSCRNRCRPSGARAFVGGVPILLARWHCCVRTPMLFRLATVNFLGNLAHAVLPSIGVLYMMYRYGWNESIVGLTLAGVGSPRSSCQGVVVGPVTRAIGERAALMFGLAFRRCRIS